MKKIQLKKPPHFLTHHVLIRPNCLARLKLPTYITQREADRLSAFLEALVIAPAEDDDCWPYDVDTDIRDDQLELNENSLSIDIADDEIP